MSECFVHVCLFFSWSSVVIIHCLSDERLEEQIDILQHEYDTTREALASGKEELESALQVSEERQVTIEELEEELSVTKTELEVLSVNQSGWLKIVYGV